MEDTSAINNKDKILSFNTFNKKKDKSLSMDIDKLNDKLKDDVEKTRIDGKVQIVKVIDITTEQPKDLKEAIVINGEIGNNEVKRGDFIYITAQLKKLKGGMQYNNMYLGVIKVRVTDIYNSINVLNYIK